MAFTTEVAHASIAVDIVLTPEEEACLDRAVNVERVTTLTDAIQEELSLGVRALHDNLREKFGDRLAEIHYVVH